MITFDERRVLSYLLVDWTEAMKADGEKSERTIDNYYQSVRGFAKWFEQTNGQLLSKTNLTQIDAREYRGYLISKGRKPATVNARLAALKAFAAWCKLDLKVKAVEQQALAPRWLDRRAQAALLREAERQANGAKSETARATANRDRWIIVLLLNTGLRVSELIALLPTDATLNERSGALVVRNGKGGKQRSVSLNREAREALRALSLPLNITARQVQRLIKHVARRAGLADVSPHTLRHTFCHNLTGANVGLEKVGALAGHNNLNVTRRYILPGAQELQQAVEVLE